MVNMEEFIEELKHNQQINIEKDLENRVDIDYVIERLEDIEKELHTMSYKDKIEEIIKETDKLIIDKLDEYDTRDLEEIIIGLVMNHTFTSKDSIQGLIYELEKLMEVLI